MPNEPGTDLELLAASPDPAARQALYSRLLTARGLIPLSGAPAGLDPGVHAVTDDLDVQVRFWRDEEENPYLPLFFTRERLETIAAIAWKLQAVNFLSVPVREFLGLEHPENLRGCVLDPGGAAVTLNRMEMADLAAGQMPGTLTRLMLQADLDAEARAEALAILPAYRFFVIVGAEVEKPDDLGIVQYRRRDGAYVLSAFTTPEAVRTFAGVWGLVQQDGNISTDYLDGAELIRLARGRGVWLGIDAGSREQIFLSPDELMQASRTGR
jgi:hypothetical protein